MLFLILFTLLSGLIAYRLAKTRTNERSDWILAVVIGVVVGVCVAVPCIVSLEYVLPHEVAYTELDRTEFVSFKGSSEVSGACFLVAGRIGMEQYYVYYYRLPDGGVRFGKKSAEGITVYEEDRADAYLVRTGKIDKFSPWVHLWLIPKFLVFGELDTYALHVPKGTIRVEQRLELP